MAFNREKTMANAQKHLRAGKVDRAIKEFERILDEDPSDIRSKLKMADLYVKGERFDEALQAYSEVAYAYATQDLYEKAAAVYKQAMRISPDDPVLYTQLGEAYFRLGRFKDAVRVFHKAQKIYKRDGDDTAQRDILERMVRIDPEDVGLRIQLAERYEKDRMGAEAQALFREAADQLKEEGRFDEYVQVVERMIYLLPGSVEMRKEVVRIYLGRGDERHALKHLQHCFKLNPQDIETLELLGSTFHRLGATEKAVLVYAELAGLYERTGHNERAASAYRTILTIDRTHAEALRFLGRDQPRTMPSAPTVSESTVPEQQVYELDPAEFDEDEEDALDGIEFLDEEDDADELFDAHPTQDGGDAQGDGFLAFAEDAIRDLESEADFNQIEAYPEVAIGGENTAAVEISESSLEIVQEVPLAEPEEFEGDDQTKQFLTESDVFLKYGLLDRAEEVITKVLQLSPDHLGGREQMRKLLIRMGDKRGAAHQLVEMARITHTDPELAQRYLRQAGEMVDVDTLRTLVQGAGLEADFAPAFIHEVSEGLDEISSFVEAGEVEDLGARTVDLPELSDVDESDDDFMLSGESAVDDDPAGLVGITTDAAMEEFTLDSLDAPQGEFDDFAVEELGDFAVDELGDFDDVDLSLEGADLVELDLDQVNFDESALSALDVSTGRGDVDLDFSAEDADAMFDELFGGAGGGVFGDDDDDNDDLLDLGVDELDLPARDDEFPPSAFGGARSLTSKFRHTTNPSIEIDMEVNNSSLELGKTYKDMGLFSEAIEEFRHAMEDSDAAPAALYHIALCHIELGEKTHAETHLSQLTEDQSAPQRWRSMASEKLNEIIA